MAVHSVGVEYQLPPRAMQKSLSCGVIQSFWERGEGCCPAIAKFSDVSEHIVKSQGMRSLLSHTVRVSALLLFSLCQAAS